MKCEDCKYFQKPGRELLTDEEREEYSYAEMDELVEDEYEVGGCHRFPAPNRPLDPNDYGDVHPEVFRDDWCGEFKSDVAYPAWSEVPWTARVRNCLDDARITSMEQLTTKTKRELLYIRNLGIASLREIQRVLGDYNLSLKNETGLK